MTSGKTVPVCGSGLPGSRRTKARRPYLKTRRASWEDDVVILVNQERVKASLIPLRTEELLRTSARNHSEHMAAEGFCAHVAPDGTTPADRMRAVGYQFPAGENIAIHLPNALGVVRAWMASPGHRTNILDPRFRSIGVGVVHLPGTQIAWWTQNFGHV